jgi:hypothetical protein
MKSITRSGVYEQITSWSDLASIPTESIITPVIVVWIELATGQIKTTQLRMGADETNIIDGIQRPNDWAANNQKVWYEA